MRCRFGNPSFRRSVRMWISDAFVSTIWPDILKACRPSGALGSAFGPCNQCPLEAKPSLPSDARGQLKRQGSRPRPSRRRLRVISIRRRVQGFAEVFQCVFIGPDNRGKLARGNFVPGLLYAEIISPTSLHGLTHSRYYVFVSHRCQRCRS